ncbi:putative glutathione S-transferase kappa 1 [Calycina marina]|uniref:Glutathione S-transferase kappa 1 n=1 Tax=Calycina marina TaxID=1763456 RepID=A0A9P7ZB51_9HELO|nr:putative glutathione S-transferase kappa 1 [Calycina marina]
MGGNIDCYLDLSSFYSYITIVYLEKNRSKLESYGITINYIPFFLGGVNVGSGNKPPWSLPAKAAHGAFDSDRAKKHHGMQAIAFPDFFPPLTILPQRALCFIKATYPPSTLITTWLSLFSAMWTTPHQNITLAPTLSSVLASTKLFSSSQVAEILSKAAASEWKETLIANTKMALDQGAFGAPWMMVTNDQGATEPFFGSDRWHFVYAFLGVGWQDVEVLVKKDEKAKL